MTIASYLKAWETGITNHGDFMCKVSLPNKEIELVYKKEIIYCLRNFSFQSVAIQIQEALYMQNIDKLQKNIQKYLLETVSCYDISNENAYHMLPDLCAIMSDRYHITSNRESGKGQFDIQLMPRDLDWPGFLIEVKAEKGCSSQKLTELSQTAVTQIIDCRYDANMHTKGITKIFLFGITFSDKDVQISAT